ncbi:MAG: flagellar motor switch protein FliG [Pseudomonadota bacterium]
MPLSGMERAATMMMALGREHGRAIWQELSDDEIRELSAAMAKLGSVEATTVESLFVDFAAEVSNVSSLHGSFDSTESLLTSMLPEDRVAGIMDEIRGPAGRTMWDKLGNVNEEVLAAYLKNEYPQTVAVVLGKIRPDHAARVLAKLPDEFGHEVVMRMLRMETVQKDILDEVEATLRTEFMSNLARTSRRDSHETMADIFNHLDRAAEERFMAALEDQAVDAAERIRALMFTFDDLARLDAASLQTLIGHADKSRLALALKGTSTVMKDLFFSHMSERARRIMKEDLDLMGPVRLREVEEAQSGTVALAKELADRGEILLADTHVADDELVY